MYNNRPSFHNQQPQFVPVYTHVIDQPIEPVAETHNLDVEVSSVIETADLAIDTGSPLPIEPTTLNIINTIVESTEIHDVVVPETPEEPAPETPEEPAPETPDVAVPETPDVAVPETHEEPAPETPEEPVPETPEVAVPETPEEPVPETTEEPAPETPEEPAPETPEEPVPETPEEPVPETPDEPAPETPDVAVVNIKYDNLPTFYIFGDSHAFYNFNDLRYDDVTLTYINCWKSGSSISSIVKANNIPNFKSDYLDPNNAFLFCYGENQLNIYIKEESESGKNEDDIILELVNQFFSVITNQCTTCRKIIVMALIPPTEFEFTTTKFREPTTLTNAYEERVRYQQKMNQFLNNKCSEIGALFFHPFSSYTNDNGCLKNEFIKSNVHISNNIPILNAFYEQILAIL